MAAFTTVPRSLAEEEPLVETTSKPKSLKRLVAGAAVVCALRNFTAPWTTPSTRRPLEA